MKLSNIVAAAISVAAITAAPAAAAETTAASPAPIAIPTPPPGKGQIVFFRPGGMGFALGCSVNENGAKVSSLGAGKYFVMVAEPGKHDFSVKTEATDKLTLLVEPDETQFAKCKIKMGIVVGRPDIQPATEGEFRKQARLKMVDADDMGPGPGALRPEEVEAALKAPAPAPVADTVESAPAAPEAPPANALPEPAPSPAT